MSFFGLHGRVFPLQQVGAPIRAATLNGPIGAINELHRRRVNPGMISIEAGGIQNEVGISEDTGYARLIAAAGSAGAYTWQGLTGDPNNPGQWLDLPAIVSDNSGVDYAYEANNHPNLAAGTRVYLRRENGSGKYVFNYDMCAQQASPAARTSFIGRRSFGQSATPPKPFGVFFAARAGRTGRFIFTRGGLATAIPTPP